MIALTKHKKIMRTSNSGSDASNPRKSRTSSAASLAQVKQIFRGKREHVLWRQGLQISSFISQNLKPRTSKNTCRCSAYSTQPQTHILLLHHHLRPTSCSSIHVSPAECTRHTIYKHMPKKKHIFYQDMYSHICIPLFRSIMVYLQPSFFLSFLSTDIGLTVGTPKTYAQRCWPSQLPPADHLRGFDGPETRKTWKSDKEQYSQTVLEETLHPEPKKETLQ